MKRLLLLAAALTVLAGCAEETPPRADTDPVPLGPPLAGWVLSPALVPLEGAEVIVQGENITVTADSGGRYAFEDLPTGTPLVVVAAADGFVPSPKSVTLRPATAHLVNFTLEAVPVLEPYHRTVPYQGFLSCALVTEGPTGQNGYPCGVDGTDERAWDVPVDAGVQGIIVEVAWEPVTELARDLNVTVETVGFGDLDAVLAEAEGASVLRAQVAQAAAERYYTGQGGILRIQVDIGADADADEAGAGVGLAVQQTFEVFVTAFYHAPPPAGFTIAEA